MSDIELFPTPAQMIRAVIEEAAKDRCVYCGGYFPKPVELHHSEAECCVVVSDE
jgi:hypothetical protein